MTEPELPLRQAVRGLLIDSGDRVLLVKLDLPLKNWVAGWVLPGGGIEPGEDAESALRRELLEETGLADAFVGPVVCRRRQVGGIVAPDFGGQEDVIHLVPCYDFSIEPAMTEDELRAEGIVDVGWFTVTQVRALPDPVYPKELPDLIDRVLEHGGSIDPLLLEVTEVTEGP